ncbi:MAG: ribose-phosphate diphosphokinase [Anaerolineae bacterium]
MTAIRNQRGSVRMYGEIALFSGTANPSLAQEVADYLQVPLRGADVFQFPNENIFVRLHESVRSQDVFVIQPTSSPVNKNIMELLIFMDTLRRDSAGRITAVVPYYAYGRTDKKDEPRVPITARLISDMITIAGADRFLTIDLHAGQIQGFFTIPVDDVTAFHMLSNYFEEKRVPNAVAVAPDLGASKKVRNFAEKLDLPWAVVEKRRASTGGGSSTEVFNLIGDAKGKNAILFDDEIDTAGTLVEAATLLRREGAKDIYACATHAVLSNPAAQNLEELGLEEVVVTNTVSIPSDKRLGNMTVLSVGELLGEVIRRIHLGVSVGEMFGE